MKQRHKKILGGPPATVNVLGSMEIHLPIIDRKSLVHMPDNRVVTRMVIANQDYTVTLVKHAGAKFLVAVQDDGGLYA